MIVTHEKDKGFFNDLSCVLDMVTEFHQKFNLDIGTISQQDMYFRCNLLLEELAEMAMAIVENTNIREELADVYYVLAGNLISMGFNMSRYQKIEINNNLSDQISFQDIIIDCGLIARSVRKKWQPIDEHFINDFFYLHLLVIKKLYFFAEQHEIHNILSLVEYKHKVNMGRTTKKVGGTNVISHWQ